MCCFYRSKLYLFSFFLILSGCGDGHIESLKASPTPYFESYSIGQLFDNRDVCNSVSWSEYEGERGEVVIEYKCEFKGVKEYEADLVKQNTAELYQILEGPGRYEESVDSLNERIAAARATIKSNEELVSHMEESDESLKFKEDIAEAKKYLKYLSGLDLEDVVAGKKIDVKSAYFYGYNVKRKESRNGVLVDVEEYIPTVDFSKEIPYLVRKIKTSGGMGVMFNEGSDEANAKARREYARNKLKEALADMVARVEHSIEKLEKSHEEYVQRKIESARESTDEMLSYIEFYEKSLEEAQSNIESHRMNSVDYVEKVVAELESRLDSVRVEEVFRWVVTPENDYSFIYAGYNENSAILGEISREYPSARDAFYRVYKNFGSFEDFMGAHDIKVYTLGQYKTELFRRYN